MRSKISRQPKSSVQLNILVTAAEMVEFFNQALKKAQEEFSLEGFRKGHVPEELIIQNVGRQYIEARSLDVAIEETYIKALKEHQIYSVAQPKIDVKKFAVVGNERSPSVPEDQIVLEYQANVDVFPEFEVKDYKNIKIKKNLGALEVTDFEVEKVLDHLRRQRAGLELIDRPLKKGDWAEISFDGFLDNVKRDELSSKNYPLIIGEAEMVPSFQEKLEGMKKDEEKTFTITFPTNHRQDFLQGRKVDFKVKILETKERILPEIDGKFVKDLGHEKIEELKEAIKKSLIQEKETLEKNRQENQLVEQLINRTKIEIPESLIDKEVERMLNDSKDRLVKINFDWPRYLEQIKKTEEDLKREMRPQAEKNIKIGLILGKIALEEGIDPHDKDGARKVIDKLMEYSNLL